MTQRPLHILVSPGFLAGLLLLLLNDFILKQQFHSEFTGKLSDFAGLFVFPLFWAALFPRLKTSFYVLTAIFFTAWKSIYAQPLIDGINLLLPFSIGRVIDMTDLAALFVLPLSYLYKSSDFSEEVAQDESGTKRRRVAIYVVGLMSVFAFTATSLKDDQSASYFKEYEFNVSREELIRGLYKTDLTHVDHLRLEENPALDSSSEDRDLYTGYLQKKTCKSSGLAYMNVYSRGTGKSALKLKFISYRCDIKAPEHERELLEEFEREVIDKLHQQQI